jgi:ADP-L-glycero-D-manno-heptose 6-epimerase
VAAGQSRGSNGLFNIGSGQARSFLDLVRAMFAGLGRPERIEFIDMPPDLRGKYQYFTEARCGSCGMPASTGRRPTLEDGVGRYVRDFLLNPDPRIGSPDTCWPSPSPSSTRS